MICPQCKKQIPDDSDECSYCGTPIDHKKQVSQEISLRRYQRWFFYGLVVLMILGMVGIIVKIYNTNNQLLADLATTKERLEKQKEELSGTQEELTQKEQNLKQTQSNLKQKESELAETQEELTAKEQELQEKTQKLKEELGNQTEIEEKYQDCQLDLSKADSNIYSLVVRLGKGVSNQKINQIPLADANLEGEDQDEDGLSDEVEVALGTNKAQADSDKDGYTDKEELLGGYNPLGEGTFETDWDFVNQNKGKILLQVDSKNEAWYIGGNGKKYFLGNPSDAYGTMRSVEYWTQNPPGEDSENATSTSA